MEAALIRIATGMSALDERQPVLLKLSAARTVAMQVGTANWLPVIRSLCATVDAFDCDARRVERTGLDDVVLRTVVMMLRPDLFFEPRWSGQPRKGFDLEPLLDWMNANLESRVTLSDIEARTGRTARAIQLAFQKRFGMGPMQWLRQQRLDLIRTRLLSAPPGVTVRDVARSCGLPRLATLIPEYVSRFGELPSETIRSHRRGM